jgi:GNAT superfamily N-acetyltransferase
MAHNYPRRFMRATLSPLLRVSLEGMRVPDQADVPQLGSLMYAAYLDTIDYEGETESEAVAEVQKTFAGEYGTFIPECSLAIERAGKLVSATLVTRFEGRPFIAFTMTEPTSRRMGFGRAGIANAMSALHARGESELRLVVTLGNEAARTLYESLGFVLQDDA